MITAIFAELTDIVTGIIGAIAQGFTDIIPIFYDSVTGLTVVGSLVLIAAGISVVSMVFRFITKLFNFKVK